MTKYLTMDLLWVLYCAWLERDFPHAAKPEKTHFSNSVITLADIASHEELQDGS
jgi:hypothetical protein